jgi:hypothetical protein
MADLLGVVFFAERTQGTTMTSLFAEDLGHYLPAVAYLAPDPFAALRVMRRGRSGRPGLRGLAVVVSLARTPGGGRLAITEGAVRHAHSPTGKDIIAPEGRNSSPRIPSPAGVVRRARALVMLRRLLFTTVPLIL